MFVRAAAWQATADAHLNLPRLNGPIAAQFADGAASSRISTRVPPPVPSTIATVPPWAPTSWATIARPSPLPPASRARAIVEAHEALEDPRAILRRYPGPVVVDREHHGVIGRRRARTRPACAACRCAFSARLATTRRRPGASPSTRAGGDVRRVDPQRRARAQALRDFEHEIVEIDRAPLEPEDLFVGAGEEEQVLDEALHTEVLGEHVLGEVGRRDAFGVRERDLGLLADRCDRRAQLVGRVRHELLLPPLRELQPVEHAVHRRREPGDLVGATGRGDAAVHLARRDLVDLGADRVHRRERASRRASRWSARRARSAAAGPRAARPRRRGSSPRPARACARSPPCAVRPGSPRPSSRPGTARRRRPAGSRWSVRGAGGR